MHTVRFVLSHVLGRSEVSDLSSALIGISGVGHVAIEPAGRSFDVQYDEHYVNPEMMRASVEGAGYPVTDVSEIE